MNKTFLFLTALLIACVAALINPASSLVVFLALGLLSACLVAPSAQLRVTLTVNELLQNVLSAFKTALFNFRAFTTDFSSATAAKGDTITGHISSLPTVRDYDNATGFKANAVAAEDLLTDVPITLSKLKHSPIKISLLTQLGSKVELANPEVMANAGYALAKYVIDDVISLAIGGKVTNEVLIAPASLWMDSFDSSIRSQANAQKLGQPRFALLNTAYAQALSNDDETKSKIYLGQGLTDKEGPRRWTNMAGCSEVREYPDWPAGNVGGMVFDRRLACLAIRSLKDIQSLASALQVPTIMRFDSISDPDTGLTLCAIG